ncbi:TetR/AcrR family transcriptional regulator [Rhodococcus fascians]|nr:TetR/AcrR family transcriptional regulator [Rhodococcus fascians]MBY4140946.1 TetR/AcrR family transcriptional regulator [Rhodococcus fascians]MBY4219610.1 TetR/AcrR family transcriptional regulator [Rhodococcus fascians]MBY4221919.1 TetR/AcrR family transcriptional regulator [Rhodococcus fascians]MBY4233920.1 TetR/AcrR family transcriptional regulator [Rhodococcus fascians]
MVDVQGRTVRAADTREVILSAAEQLYAELGVFAVSNRQVSEAAGQGNNAAVGYHFGTKTDLVRAIVCKHAAAVDALRTEMLTDTVGSTDLRDWLSCLVRPSMDHLSELGNPTWYARFSAQILTDPTLRSIIDEHALASPSLNMTLAGLERCTPTLPEAVRAARRDMARTLVIHVIADRERFFATSAGSKDADWTAVSNDLVDALCGLWSAPVTR